MKAVFLGASKGTGYFTLLNLLTKNSNWNAILLLRKINVFDDNNLIKPFIENGRIKIIKGDATNEDDVARLFEGEKIDLVVSTIGAAPVFGLTGFSIDQPDLCTKGSIALLHVLENLKQPLPRVIVISSMGLGSAHKEMPLVMRLLYGWLLEKPHQDKQSLEYLFHRSAINLPEITLERDIPSKKLLSQDMINSTKSNFLPEVIIVKPAFMPTEEPIDALSKSTTDKYRVGDNLSCYTVKRSDVGKFISEYCIPQVNEEGEDKWVNRCPVIGN